MYNNNIYLKSVISLLLSTLNMSLFAGPNLVLPFSLPLQMAATFVPLIIFARGEQHITVVYMVSTW